MGVHLKPAHPRRSVTGPVAGVACLLCASAYLVIAAQQLKSDAPIVAEKRGVWRPVEVDAATTPDSPFPLTAVEARLMNEQLRRLAAVFARLRVLNPPMGFEVHPRAHFGPYRWEPSRRPGPAPGYVMMPFYGYFNVCNPDCHVVLGTAAEPLVVIIVSANSIGSIEWRGKPGWQDDQGPMFLEPRLIGHVAGFPKYDDEFVVLTRIERPLWIPVSQERFIRNAIGTWKKHQADVEPAAKLSPYQQWLREKDTRARESEKAYQDLRKVDSKAAETYRAQMAKTEEEVTERLKAEDAKYQAAAAGGIATVARQVAALEAELASLSPAARTSPAHYLGSHGAGARPSELADAGRDGARRVVMPNPDFFDSRRSKTSFQLLAVKFEPRVEDLRDHVAHFPWTNDVFALQTLEAVMRDVDWTLLASLLDEDSRANQAHHTGRRPQTRAK